VSHHEDQETLDRPNGLPPGFAAFDSILHRDVQRILKDLLGFLEAHTVMLALIERFLASSHSNRGVIIARI
jgi:hypothetical protein